MAGQVYFGNKKFQTWIPAPQSPMEAGSVGYASESQFLNGRAFVKRSRASHRAFAPSWFGRQNDNTVTGLNTVKDFQDGVYGDGPFYWVDPFASGQNILPPHWAAPALTEKDWPNLASGVTPTFSSVTYANGFPQRTATYSLGVGYNSTNKLVIIIPNGYTLNFGWHSSAAGISGSTRGFTITPYLRSTGAASTAIYPVSLLAGGTTKTNTTIDGTTYSYVEIGITCAGTAQTLDIVGVIAQILPTGTSVTSGGFISGRGTTALEFSSFSSIQYYSSNIDNGQIGLSVNLTEVDK